MASPREEPGKSGTDRTLSAFRGSDHGGKMDLNALEQAEPVLKRLAADPQQPANVVTAAKEALQRIHPRPK